MAPVNAYTHGHHSTVLRSHSLRTIENSAAYLAPLLGENMTLLDIGAGPGTITADLAARVAHVTASEIGEAELQHSRRTAGERGMSNIDFVVEDAHALSFADDSFDVVHAHQVLQHLVDPVRALREMARVTKPGGTLAARDADYGGFLWYPDRPEIGEWIQLYSRTARGNGGEPDAGRRLLSWALQAGLEDVTASSSAWTYADESGRRNWAKTWADRIVRSSIAQQLVTAGDAHPVDLRRISEGWNRWADVEGGWFMVPHGEILYRKPMHD